MKSGPPDLFAGSACEASRKKKKKGEKKREGKGDVNTSVESYDVWWQNVSAQLLSGLPFEFEWIGISFTVIS